MKELVDKFEGQWISGIKTIYKEDASNYYDDNPNTLLRASVELKKSKEPYYLNVGCLGYYIAYINGRRVGDYELNSDWTQYDKRIYYDRYDVTELLVNGKNIIAFELGNGMYNPSPLKLFGKYNLRERLSAIGEPCVIANLFEGRKCILSTGESWKISTGQLLFNNLYLGERFDSRLDQKDWLTNEFDDKDWIKAVIDNGKKGQLVKSEIPKSRKIKTIKPTDIKVNARGNLVVDFIETLSGMISITFNGTEGKSVKLIYGEEVTEEGIVDCYSTIAGKAGVVLKDINIKFDGGPGSPKLAIQKDEIICVDGENYYENKFTYHSFRYVEIIGLTKESLINFEASYVYSDVDIVGKIIIDNLWLENLYDIAEKTKLNNIHSVFEDCARERLGYGGDIVALATSNLFMFDLAKLYKKVVIDFRQDQTENGGIPETAPYIGIQTNGTGQGEGPILWQFVYPYIVYKCYQYYGDEELVKAEYECLKKQMKYLMDIGIENLEDRCLGDHGSVDTSVNFKVGTPDKKFLAYCTYVLFLKYNSYFAKVMNDPILEEYQYEIEKSKSIINDKFRNADGTYGDKTQSSFAFAIFTQISDDSADLCDKFVHKIKDDNYHLRSGIFGLMMSYEVLNKYGYDEVVEKWLLKKEYPSIGYMTESGKTALSEWFKMEESSHNHAMLSSYTQWYYQGLAGITVDDDAVKGNKIMLRPYFSEYIKSFKCCYKTYYGEINSNWEKNGDVVIWNYTVPKNGLLYKMIIPKEYKILHTTKKENVNSVNECLTLQKNNYKGDK